MKNKMTKVMLVLLPFLAVVFATTGDSVQLIEVATGEVVKGSYFTMLNDSVLAVTPLYAALGGILALVTAAVFIFNHKKGLLKFSRWCAFVGATLAVLPYFRRGEFLLLPNVMLPLLLFVQFVLATFALKWDLEAKPQDQAPRLDRH